MGLRVFAPVLEWVQQLRVQASQVLSVDLVSFAFVGVDEPQLPGIGHQHLMATLLEHPACPRRVGSGLYGDAQRPLGDEASFACLWGSAQPTFLHNLATVPIDEAQG